jgi:hypothetical protein
MLFNEATISVLFSSFYIKRPIMLIFFSDKRKKLYWKETINIFKEDIRHPPELKESKEKHNSLPMSLNIN